MTQTVFGDRWVYDRCSDPVYVTALATVILTGGHEADPVLEHRGWAGGAANRDARPRQRAGGLGPRPADVRGDS